MMTSRYKARLAALAIKPMQLEERFPKGSKYKGRTLECICYDDPNYVIFCHENHLYVMCQRALDIAYHQLDRYQSSRE